MGENGLNHAHRSRFARSLRESLREWATHTERGVELQMPVARYFLLVGGAPLLLLLVTGVFLPSLPAIERAEAPRATIRIHSEMKPPERVVFDTSMPTVAACNGPCGGRARRATPRIRRRCLG